MSFKYLIRRNFEQNYSCIAVRCYWLVVVGLFQAVDVDDFDLELLVALAHF